MKADTMKNVLTIAGSDSSGGAGIQADLKTMCALGVYGMSAITAVTVQNTQGVYAVQDIRPDIVAGQIDAVFNDIRVDAVKIGMVSAVPIIRIIRERLLHHQAKNIVVDPVMVSKTKCRLVHEDAEKEILSLIAIADIATPNIYEAEVLSGLTISGRDAMPPAAEKIRSAGAKAVLVKGGLLQDSADDYLLLETGGLWLPGDRIDTNNNQGTGCSLASAVACGLACGLPIEEAARRAKAFVRQGILDALPVGHGVGPLGHLVELYRKAGVSCAE